MRRKILITALLVSIAGARLCASPLPPASVVTAIRNSPAVAVLSDGTTTSKIRIDRKWSGDICSAQITNESGSPLRVKEIVLCSAAKLFAGNTNIYGEGFQLLSQTRGTLAAPEDLGQYTDRGHYKLAEPPGYRVVYNLLYLQPPGSGSYLLGFTSANHYVGKFYLSADTVKVVVDLENLELPTGASWKLEEFYMGSGSSRNDLFDMFAGAIQRNHPRLTIPLATGWCSWYCFGPEVTAKDIYNNLAAIKQKIPQLKYIQLDDGYQTHMGDWLSVGNSFDGGIKDVLAKIKEEGFQPAIWVAPFICDSNSQVFKEHKDWLVMDSAGQPLRSDKVGFGGWRLKPWYVLDGTNPAVQQHFKELFSTLRNEWNCTYFKLDANYWGAIHGATYYRKNATRTDAYREGMKAILQGAGEGAFILGCNQPMWPSLGLIHGARTSMDISRSWEEISHTGKENLYRSWQNGKLWWNDPDCLVLTGDLPDNIFMFHAALIYATGGMLLSGDDISSISEKRLPILKELADPSGVAAKFNDDSFAYGWVKEGNKRRLVVLNWDEESKTIRIPITKSCVLYNFFTGERVGKFNKEILLSSFAGRNGAIYRVE